MSSDMDYFKSALMSASASTSTSDLTTPRPPRTGGISSSASTPTCHSRRPVQPDLTTPRAQARAKRLRAFEDQERREDQAALVTTPAQWALLRRSFVGVKTEFTDLDGLSWDASATRSSGAASYQPVCVSATSSAPALALDDNDSTVRPYQRKRERLSVSAPGWEQAVSGILAARS